MQAVAATDEPRPRQTIRRYAHELFPHADEVEKARPLAVEVPYLYALAIGHDPSGTSWFEMTSREATADQRRIGASRINDMIQTSQLAMVADALHQGLTGDEAWAWAYERLHPDLMGECVWERAVQHGVDPDAIKPYPCGPEPQHHDHLSEPDARGWRTSTRIGGPESECDDCCEPEAVVVADEALPLDGSDQQ